MQLKQSALGRLPEIDGLLERAVGEELVDAVEGASKWVASLGVHRASHEPHVGLGEGHWRTVRY